VAPLSDVADASRRWDAPVAKRRQDRAAGAVPPSGTCKAAARCRSTRDGVRTGYAQSCVSRPVTATGSQMFGAVGLHSVPPRTPIWRSMSARRTKQRCYVFYSSGMIMAVDLADCSAIEPDRAGPRASRRFSGCAPPPGRGSGARRTGPERRRGSAINGPGPWTSTSRRQRKRDGRARRRSTGGGLWGHRPEVLKSAACL